MKTTKTAIATVRLVFGLSLVWCSYPLCASTLVLDAVADASISNGSNSSTNYGSQTGLVVGRDTAGKTWRFVVKWDIENQSVLKGATITNVDIRFQGSTTASGGNIDVLFGRVSGSWTESKVTWNNAPNFTTLATSTYPTGNPTAGTIDFKDNKDTFAKWAQGIVDGTTANNGLSVESSSSNFFTFRSRESTAPQLVITYSAAQVADVFSFTPVVAVPGSTVTIDARYVTGATSVKFNGVSATIVSVVGNTLTIVAPSGYGYGGATITTPAGTSTSKKMLWEGCVISGHVQSREYPFDPINDAVVAADYSLPVGNSQSSVTTDEQGNYSLMVAVNSSVTLTANKYGFWGEKASGNAVKTFTAPTTSNSGYDFTDFFGQSVPNVSLQIDKANPKPGDVVVVTYTLGATNALPAYDFIYGDVSVEPTYVDVGAPSGTNWTTGPVVYPKGSANVYGITGRLLSPSQVAASLVSALRKGTPGAYSFSFPLTIKASTPPGTVVTLLYRASMGGRRDPVCNPNSGAKDQQGFNVYAQTITVAGTPLPIGLRVSPAPSYPTDNAIVIPVSTDASGTSVTFNLKMPDGTVRQIDVTEGKVTLSLAPGSYSYSATATKSGYNPETATGAFIVGQGTLSLQCTPPVLYSGSAASILWQVRTSSAALTDASVAYQITNSRGDVVTSGSSTTGITFTPSEDDYNLGLSVGYTGYKSATLSAPLKVVRFSIDAPSTIALGTSATFTTYVLNLPGSTVQYRVTSPSQSSPLSGSVASGTAYKLTPIYPETHTVTLTVPNTPLSKTISLTVSGYSDTLDSYPNTPQTIYVGQSTTFKFLISRGGTTQPTAPVRITIDGKTSTTATDTFTYTGQVAGTHTLAVTGDLPDRSTNTVYLTVVVQAPAIQVSPVTDQTITTSDTLTYVVTGTNAYTVQLKNTVTGTSNSTTSSLAQYPVSGLAAGSYDLVFSAGSSSVARHLVVTVGASPTVTVTASTDKNSYNYMDVANVSIAILNAQTYSHTIDEFVNGNYTRSFDVEGNTFSTTLLINFGGVFRVNYTVDHLYTSNSVEDYAIPPVVFRSGQRLLEVKADPAQLPLISVRQPGGNWSLITQDKFHALLLSDTFRQQAYVVEFDKNYATNYTAYIVDENPDNTSGLTSFFLDWTNANLNDRPFITWGKAAAFIPYISQVMALEGNAVSISYSKSLNELYVTSGDPVFLQKQHQALTNAGVDNLLIFAPNFFEVTGIGAFIGSKVTAVGKKFYFMLPDAITASLNQAKTVVVKEGIAIISQIDAALAPYATKITQVIPEKTSWFKSPTGKEATDYVAEVSRLWSSLESKGVSNVRSTTKALLDNLLSLDPKVQFKAVAQLNHLRNLLDGLDRTIGGSDITWLRQQFGSATADFSAFTAQDLSELAGMDTKEIGEGYVTAQLKILKIPVLAQNVYFRRLLGGVSSSLTPSAFARADGELDNIIRYTDQKGIFHYILDSVKSPQGSGTTKYIERVADALTPPGALFSTTQQDALTLARKDAVAAFYRGSDTKALSDAEARSVISQTEFDQFGRSSITADSTITRMLSYNGGDWIADVPALGLSVLAQSGSGEYTSTAGFVTSGLTQILIRGVGPSLAQFVKNYGKSPSITLHNTSTGNDKVVVVADDWRYSAQQSDIIDAENAIPLFALGTDNNDAAALVSIPAGSYTVALNNGNNTDQVLLEVYAVSGAIKSIKNMSSRVYARPGTPAILGFNLSTAKFVVCRAVTATLGSFGVQAPADDPSLKLFNGQTLVDSNDNWTYSQSLVDLEASLGAFPIRKDSNEALIYRSLPAGVYTLQCFVKGEGVALIEVYMVDP